MTTDKAQALENIQRIKDAAFLIKTARRWLDRVGGYDCGDMSLRFKQYEGLLIIEYCILERELIVFEED